MASSLAVDSSEGGSTLEEAARI
ncbi:hypothetical protein M6B38_213690 [Iris pallida]|uniref:Uncharacterized protein n=1 Tax=Iris pallida TaxID=29817 RepID=A0AAX6E2F9_IRIPA|nr:hypothetical protein M6B38_213690 [Iris pallida]